MALNISPPYLDLGCEKILTRVISLIDKLKSSLVRPDLASRSRENVWNLYWLMLNAGINSSQQLVIGFVRDT